MRGAMRSLRRGLIASQRAPGPQRKRAVLDEFEVHAGFLKRPRERHEWLWWGVCAADEHQRTPCDGRRRKNRLCAAAAYHLV